MNATQRIELGGKRYVVLEEEAFERMREAANELPPLPQPDERGRVPAVAYARASIARDIIAERRAAGLTQTKLAELSGIRQETLSRIESGKHTPSEETLQKIDDGLTKATKRRRR